MNEPDVAGPRERPAFPPTSGPVRSSYMTPIEPDPGCGEPGPAPPEPGRAAADADLAITAMYAAEYRSLVRMSALVLGDVATAEEVVQESFIAVHAAWRGLRDIDNAVHYLRRSVLNRSRSVLRHRAVVDRHTPRHEPEMPSAEQSAITRLERSAVISALRSLPVRQREALVLKFYLDLSEAQVASAMSISAGAVKSHTSRGKAAMRAILNTEQ